MRSEAELRRAYYLLGAVLDLNENSCMHPLPEDQAKLVTHGHALLAWTLGAGAKFDVFIDSIESQLAAFDLQVVELAGGGARIVPLRHNHRKRTSTRKR